MFRGASAPAASLQKTAFVGKTCYEKNRLPVREPGRTAVQPLWLGSLTALKFRMVTEISPWPGVCFFLSKSKPPAEHSFAKRQ